MKAGLRFESGKGFHVTLQPESEEESAECRELVRHFDARHPAGTQVRLSLAYIAAHKTGDILEDMKIGMAFR